MLQQSIRILGKSRNITLLPVFQYKQFYAGVLHHFSGKPNVVFLFITVQYKAVLLLKAYILDFKYYYYYRYSALGPVWAETRAQSGDWYGSGTLHPGQVLWGSLPLLSPAFRHSHFRHQVSPRRHDARDPSGGRWNCGRECCPVMPK